MRVLLLCVVIASAFHACLGGADNRLFVKFATRIDDPQRKGSFFELPRSLNGLSGKDEKWDIIENRINQDGVSVACRNNDYRICLLVDRQNSVAGLEYSVAADDMVKSNNAIVKTPQRPNVRLGVNVYTTTVYFVGQDVLRAGGRAMTEDTPTAPNGFFANTGTPEGLRNIPVDEEEIKKTKYTRQSCFPGMGRHYFYDLTKKSACETLDGFFALYNEHTHKLAGMGFIAYGTSSVQENGRAWFETLPSNVVMHIAPGSPECAPEFIDKYGSNVMHIYVGDEPWNLDC